MTYVLFNDAFIKEEEVKIELTDRGYQFGDGLYEVIRVYDGKIFTAQEHLERFLRSAHELFIQLPFSIEELTNNVETLIEKNELINGSIYLQLTRGVAPRNHFFPEPAVSPQFVAYTNIVERNTKNFKEGVTAITDEDIRWLRCDIKSLNLLGAVLSKQKAHEGGHYEAILHRDGAVTEGSSSNIFIVKDDVLYTHPVNNLILNGITRLEVLKICNENGFSYKEKAFTTNELKEADEVFLTSTTSEITPIINIDGEVVGNGTVGDFTKKLQALYEIRF